MMQEVNAPKPGEDYTKEELMQIVGLLNVDNELKHMLDAFYVDDMIESKFYGQLKSDNRARQRQFAFDLANLGVYVPGLSDEPTERSASPIARKRDNASSSPIARAGKYLKKNDDLKDKDNAKTGNVSAAGKKVDDLATDTITDDKDKEASAAAIVP